MFEVELGVKSKSAREKVRSCFFPKTNKHKGGEVRQNGSLADLVINSEQSQLLLLPTIFSPT